MNNFFFNNLSKNYFLFLIIFSSYTLPAFSESGVSVFMYHRFGEDKYPSTNVSEEQFLSHIDYILNNEIKVIKFEELIKDKNVESGTIGYRGYQHASPVTLFLSTEIIDNRTNGYMTWEEIKTFVDEGGSIGQHTSSHLHMPLNSISEIKEDILNSHKSWIKNIGYIPKLFAYPYGESSNEVIDILKEFGISHAFGQHSGVISSFDNQYYLPRFSLNERFGDIDRFEFAVNAYSLNIKDFLPGDMFLIDNKKPLIEFSILNNLKGSPIDCFSNPGGKWDKQEIINIKKNRFQIKLKEDYLSGRARLNCTTKVDDEWYWFGYQFLVK